MKQKWYGGDFGLQTRMLITMALLAILYLGFVAAMFAAGVNSFVIFVFATVMLGVQYFFSDKLALASAGARVVEPNEEPELHAMIDRLVQAADLPKPKVAIIDSSVPNAFATGRTPSAAAVAVTTGLMKTLERAELEAVLALSTGIDISAVQAVSNGCAGITGEPIQEIPRNTSITKNSIRNIATSIAEVDRIGALHTVNRS